MRSGLVAIGVILLVVGSILYFIPPAQASSTSVATEKYAVQGDPDIATTTDNSTSNSTFPVSAADNEVAPNGLRTLSILSMIIGGLLTIIGLVLPDERRVATARTSASAARRHKEAKK